MASTEPALARDVVVMGGSAGSVGVLQKFFSGVPKDLPAAFLVVVHQAQASPGRMPEVIGGAMACRHAEDGEPIELGRVYVAPPDLHMMVEPAGRIRLSRGPKQNRFRPAIDPLFRTAARVFGAQVVGVVMSGMLDDGTFGLMQVKRFGGVTICQSPADAESPDMPASAIRHVRPDYVVKGEELVGLITKLVRDPGRCAHATVPMAARRTPTFSVGIPSEAGDIADRGDNALLSHGMTGPPTALTCPQCGGAIWETTEGGMPYYRCHVGHAYSGESLASEHDSELEQTLWEAMRMFQENAMLNDRMAARATSEHSEVARRYRERARESEKRTEFIRGILLGESGRGPA